LRDRFLWRDGGVPGGTNARTFFARSGVTENLIAGHAEVRVAPRIRVIGDLAWRAKEAPYDDSADEIGVGAQSTKDRFHQPTLSLRGEFEPTEWLRILPFVGLAVDTYTPVTLQSVVADAGDRIRASSTFKIAGELNLLDDRLQVTGHVTGHVLDSRTEGVDAQAVANVSPAIAIAARPTDWITVRGSAVGQAFRPPAFHELFGDRGLTAGRAGLRPERADSVDGGVRLRSPDHRWVGGSVDVGGFLSHKADTIAWGVNSDGVATPGNLGQTREAGVELAGSLAFLGHVSATGSATYTDSTITEGAASVLGNRLPGVPLWQVHVGVQAFWDPYVRVGWRFDYTSGSFDSSSNFFEQAPRPLHSVNARVQPGAAWPWIAVDISNLTHHIVATQARDPLHPDENDRTVVPVQDFRGSPLPGRAVQIAVGWTWPESARAAQENR
jgi:hypothetical protein